MQGPQAPISCIDEEPACTTAAESLKKPIQASGKATSSAPSTPNSIAPILTLLQA